VGKHSSLLWQSANWSSKIFYNSGHWFSFTLKRIKIEKESHSTEGERERKDTFKKWERKTWKKNVKKSERQHFKGKEREINVINEK
jgi:hypothetical protein